MSQLIQQKSGLFIRLIKHPLKSRAFLLFKIPSAFFSGVRVISVDQDHCSVKAPFTWFSKNPFRSTYFACLSMAAEMSSGILAMAQIYGSTQAVSMLVIKMEALYYRKAVGTTIFTCLDGLGLINCIESAIATGEGQVITTKSTGIGPEGMLIAEFFVTWSFKVKKERTK